MSDTDREIGRALDRLVNHLEAQERQSRLLYASQVAVFVGMVLLVAWVGLELSELKARLDRVEATVAGGW